MKIRSNKINLLIIGAGKAGELVGRDIMAAEDGSYNLIGYVDDDSALREHYVNNKPVLGNISSLATILSSFDIDELLIAVPSVRGSAVRRVLDQTIGKKLHYKIVPNISEVLLEDYENDYKKYIRALRVEDILGGQITKNDQVAIRDYIKDQTILITGAAGSIGSELSRQVSAYGAKKIIMYDWWENGIFELHNQLTNEYPNGSFEFVIGDIKDRDKLNEVLRMHKPSTIFHAAAYKHVPLMEINPAESVKNNILGTKIVGELAIKHHVEKFILISSDKAVNPTNVMGATKRAAEKIIHILSRSQTITKFCAVRFGNVINSNGSAIPIFLKQIDQGGPVTVTSKDITRYFMTIPEAVHLVLQSWMLGENNDLFVLDMGEPIKIYDLVKYLIVLQGYIPESEIKINITGLRPGEKLYEELLIKEEETQVTTIKKIFKTKNHMGFDPLVFLNRFNIMMDALDDDDMTRTHLQSLVSTYKPNK